MLGVLGGRFLGGYGMLNGDFGGAQRCWVGDPGGPWGAGMPGGGPGILGVRFLGILGCWDAGWEYRDAGWGSRDSECGIFGDPGVLSLVLQGDLAGGRA